MFRNPKLLEKTNLARFSLNTSLEFPGGGQYQKKTGYKFVINDRNNWYDLYNGYFRVNYTCEAVADGAAVAADTTSSTLNGSASLIKKLEVKSAGKNLYNIDNAHKAVFIKNLLDFSDDYARSTAKSQFWYLDNVDSVIVDPTNANVNSGIMQREKLTQARKTVETIIPLNRYSFFEELEDRMLPPMNLEFNITLQDDSELIFQNNNTDFRRVVVRDFELWVPSLQFTSEGQKLLNENFLKPTKFKYLHENIYTSTSRTDANGLWQITPGLKIAKHVFVFLQRTAKNNDLRYNPYIFDTFKLNANNNASKLLTCRLQSGASEFYPELEYTSDFKERILQDVINFRYRKNDYNTGTQLNVANYSTLYPLIYFDLRADKSNLTNDPQQLVFHYRLNTAATDQCTIYAVVLHEEEIVIDKVGGEIVVVKKI